MAGSTLVKYRNKYQNPSSDAEFAAIYTAAGNTVCIDKCGRGDITLFAEIFKGEVNQYLSGFEIPAAMGYHNYQGSFDQGRGLTPLLIP